MQISRMIYPRDLHRQIVQTAITFSGVVIGLFIHSVLTHGWERAFLRDLPSELGMMAFFGLFAVGARAFYAFVVGDLRLRSPHPAFADPHSSNADPL